MDKVNQLRNVLVLWLVTISTSSLLGQSNRLEVLLAPRITLEDFSWSIAGNLEGTSPNILSELEWENLVNLGFDVGLNYKISNRLQVRITQVLTTTLNGNVTDTDYENDDRQNPVFNTTENADEGFYLKSAIETSYEFPVGSNLYLTPYFGMVYSKRKLSIINISNGLDSSYRPDTYGAEFGTAISKVFNHHWELNLRSMFGAAKYRASGNWNLIDELRQPESFTHRANIYNISAQLSLIRRLKKSSLALVLFYEHASTDAGIDTLFFEDGTVAFTRFNGAARETIGLGVRFGRWIW